MLNSGGAGGASGGAEQAAIHFYDAIIQNDMDALRRAVEVFKVDLNAKFTLVRKQHHFDLFPVHLVAYKGYLSMLHYLIQTGVAVNQTTATLHRHAVHYAALRSQLSCLQMLVNAGGKIDARDTFGNTPLHYAAEDGNVILMSLLLHNGASLDAQDITNKTPLMKATRNGKLAAVKRLTAAGASVNLKDKNEDTALHFAARHGSGEMTCMLIRAEARVDAQNQWGLTPLMEAVSYNQKEVVAALIKHRCDLYKRDFRTGDTSLHIAVKKNYTDLVSMLLSAGNWYIQYNFNNFGESFVHDVVVYNRLDLLRLFVTYNYNFDYPAKKTPTGVEKLPFQLVLERGHLEMAKILAQ
uniref:ANK_REP_REGION domain-containing protein n=1 Tax=Macrostomum lignano TaxID=282301 RepID=A0A1I8I5G8_9PLAT